VIGIDLTKIARLVHENKLENLAEIGGLNYVMRLDKQLATRPIPIEDAIAGLNSLFHAFHYVTRSVLEIDEPSDFQIYKQAYELVKTQFLKGRKSSREQKDSSSFKRLPRMFEK